MMDKNPDWISLGSCDGLLVVFWVIVLSHIITYCGIKNWVKLEFDESVYVVGGLKWVQQVPKKHNANQPTHSPDLPGRISMLLIDFLRVLQDPNLIYFSPLR
jgi:hypothetical protein